MTDFDDIKLENYEGEDISDVIVKLEKSFDLKFRKLPLQRPRPLVIFVILLGHISTTFTKMIALSNKLFIRSGKPLQKHSLLPKSKSASAATWLNCSQGITGDKKVKNFEIG